MTGVKSISGDVELALHVPLSTSSLCVGFFLGDSLFILVADTLVPFISVAHHGVCTRICQLSDAYLGTNQANKGRYHSAAALASATTCQKLKDRTLSIT